MANFIDRIVVTIVGLFCAISIATLIFLLVWGLPSVYYGLTTSNLQQYKDEYRRCITEESVSEARCHDLARDYAYD